MISVSANEVRILILAPRGRDATLISSTLSDSGIRALPCSDVQSLIGHFEDGAAAAIIAEEALTVGGLRALSGCLGSQPPWSDLPVVVLTHGGRSTPTNARRMKEFEVLGNVTYLDRPSRPETVRSSMRAALRARMRQYETRHREEILSRVNGDLERFAYSASHDLQEPIRNVAIFSEILAAQYGDLLDKPGMEFLARVHAAAIRMQTLVRDLLDYTQAASIVDERPEPCDASAAFDGAMQNLAHTIPADASITHDSLPSVKIGAIHLQQMFQNLIGNAIKYRAAVPLQIHVSAEQRSGFWRFCVGDNGIGISPEYKDQIFGIFKRLHTQQKYPGTGIGLAICQRIAERYGGKIWVESELAKGARFWFTVPV
jgi:signal transduction histidine kinase